ncbi:MAG: hypothetical protein GY796_01440 [Chloroflexi bacterium]|nr:hypothetical protein [Chloroflexota bacterium]
MSNQEVADSAYLFELQKLLATHYDLQELRTLALHLNLDLEDVRGERKSDKARELTLLLARQNRLLELLAALQKERPHVNWPPIPDIISLPSISFQSIGNARNRIWAGAILIRLHILFYIIVHFDTSVYLPNSIVTKL